MRSVVQGCNWGSSKCRRKPVTTRPDSTTHQTPQHLPPHTSSKPQHHLNTVNTMTLYARLAEHSLEIFQLWTFSPRKWSIILLRTTTLRRKLLCYYITILTSKH